MYSFRYAQTGQHIDKECRIVAFSGLEVGWVVGWNGCGRTMEEMGVNNNNVEIKTNQHILYILCRPDQ